MNRKQIADAIDGLDEQIKALNAAKSDLFKSFRVDLEDAGMEPLRAAAEAAVLKAAIARRRKLADDPADVHEHDALIDGILAEITRPHVHARAA